MTDSMNSGDRERLSDFLILLKIWGCWSRGGLPRYKCGLDDSSAGIIPIDPDEAQHIDSVLAQIKFVFGSWKTSSFEKYYVGGMTISAIANKDKKTRYCVAAEISEIESLLFFACKK